nr:uncharacterized protein LOC126535613 [Dermacentor andersoni]
MERGSGAAAQARQGSQLPASYCPVSLTSAARKVFEALALRRLECITAALNTFAAEQSCFRRLRATADCLADVIATLDTATRRGEAGYLALLDVESAFGYLLHATILDAISALGVSAARQCSKPIPVNFALARIPDYIPRFPAHEVRVALYADDIALFASGPTSVGYAVRACVQCATVGVDAHISGIGLTLSVAKTEALIVHPTYGGQYSTPGFTLRGVLLPWQKRVRYLALVIDRQLKWCAAVAALQKGAAQVAGAARSLLARGQGCSLTLALRLYNRRSGRRWMRITEQSSANSCAYRGRHKSAPIWPRRDRRPSFSERRAINPMQRLYRSRHSQQVVTRFALCQAPA